MPRASISARAARVMVLAAGAIENARLALERGTGAIILATAVTATAVARSAVEVPRHIPLRRRHGVMRGLSYHQRLRSLRAQRARMARRLPDFEFEAVKDSLVCWTGRSAGCRSRTSWRYIGITRAIRSVICTPPDVRASERQASGTALLRGLAVCSFRLAAPSDDLPIIESTDFLFACSP
jgi:hypothetical protein